MPRRLLHLALLLVSLAPLACACEGDDDDDVHGDPLELVDAVLPAGQVGEPYEATLRARGGRAPYTLRAGSGLPSGLTLQPDGRLAGTPTDEGDFSLEVVVEDADGGRAHRRFPLPIAPADEPAPLRIVTERVPAADLGEPYSMRLLAEGGVPPYTWSVTAGPLPRGLELDPVAGTITGTPLELGAESVELQVEDAAGETERATFELAVVTPPELLTKLLPIAVVGEPYAASLEVLGGSWPFAFEAYSGTLPDGLTLHPSGLIAGSATERDSRPVRFRVTDGAGVARDQRIRIWVVQDHPWEGWPDVEIPASCGLVEPVVGRGTLAVDDPAMIARVQVAVDVDYADIAMLEIDLVAPDGTRVPLHAGDGGVGGGVGLHFLLGRPPFGGCDGCDRIAAGSFTPLIGLGPRGTWTLEVKVLADPGFGCVEDPGRIQRFAVVIGAATSSDDYALLRGVETNSFIDGPYARITGGGLDQDAFDLVVEQWTTGADGIPEGGTGDDVLVGTPAMGWASDLPADVGVLDPAGHFQSGESTGQGTVTGASGALSIELPVKVVPPDWVP